MMDHPPGVITLGTLSCCSSCIHNLYEQILGQSSAVNAKYIKEPFLYTADFQCLRYALEPDVYLSILTMGHLFPRAKTPIAQQSKPPPLHGRLPIDRMSLGRRFVIGTPYFNRLVRLTTDEPQPGVVECGAEHAVLGIERAWLGNGVHGLVTVARFPVLLYHVSRSQLRKDNRMMLHLPRNS